MLKLSFEMDTKRTSIDTIEMIVAVSSIRYNNINRKSCDADAYTHPFDATHEPNTSYSHPISNNDFLTHSYVITSPSIHWRLYERSLARFRILKHKYKKKLESETTNEATKKQKTEKTNRKSEGWRVVCAWWRLNRMKHNNSFTIM